ncbi:MAG: CoA-transferase subunit beta [bacterium]|nr:CoA-transferase subunit beta [bacterium]MDE0288568.1 CoA-transferase subunit beta [bacterium]MDE0440075.1 CoA-transferase subunit beta [bacterium]
MAVVGSRGLRDGMSCFVGIGLPSTVANLARLTHAPGLFLIYESGVLGSKPTKLPLSIGDGELAETADAVVPVPEIFNYWLQGGHIDVGYLGAAQIDRFGNLNTTVIGNDYRKPKVRLPGAGGAPEIASYCREVTVIMRHLARAFVTKLDFLTSVGLGERPGTRSELGFTGAGPQTVITDLGVLKPHPEDRELTLVAVHPGVTVEQVKEQTGWPLRVSCDLQVTKPPTDYELEVLRDLKARS